MVDEKRGNCVSKDDRGTYIQLAEGRFLFKRPRALALLERKSPSCRIPRIERGVIVDLDVGKKGENMRAEFGIHSLPSAWLHAIQDGRQ